MVLCGPISRVKCKWVSFWSRNRKMLGALVIVFREVIEAGLIVGIVMAATRGVAGRGRWVSFGIGAGAATVPRILLGLKGGRQCQLAFPILEMLQRLVGQTPGLRPGLRGSPWTRPPHNENWP